MIKYYNDCCDCAVPPYPCAGNSCSLRNNPHYFCDECGAETQLYDWNGQELCIDCIEMQLDKINVL